VFHLCSVLAQCFPRSASGTRFGSPFHFGSRCRPRHGFCLLLPYSFLAWISVPVVFQRAAHSSTWTAAARAFFSRRCRKPLDSRVVGAASSWIKSVCGATGFDLVLGTSVSWWIFFSMLVTLLLQVSSSVSPALVSSLLGLTRFWQSSLHRRLRAEGVAPAVWFVFPWFTQLIFWLSSFSFKKLRFCGDFRVNHCRDMPVLLLSRWIKRLEESWFKSLSRGDFPNAPTRCSVKCLWEHILFFDSIFVIDLTHSLANTVSCFHYGS
jgi:hypothetical protein